MKRITAIMLTILVTLVALAAALPGCGKADKSKNGKISVVCTIFPQYDWARQILGDKAGNMELTLLVDSKIDLHSYQPSVDDVVKISSCDLFIYIGGESDEWVEGALTEAKNKKMVVINLLEALGDKAKEESTLEGMEAEEAEGEGGDGDEVEYDEHIWLSLKNAATLCPIIEGALSSLDAANAETYKGNLAAYLEQLNALDAKYQEAASGAAVKTVLFGDRFPFRYLTDDYGLTPYAAFSGCSAESEASFETIVFLAKKVDELALKNVLVTESANQSIAKTVVSNTKAKDQKILTLDAMQSVTSGDIRNGATYLSIMEGNLNVLKEALK